MNLYSNNQIKRAILVVLIVLLHAEVFAQITVNAQSNTLKSVLTHIERQTGYAFAYNQSLVDDSKLVSVELVDGDIHQLMKALLKHTNYVYRVYGKYVVISPAEDVTSRIVVETVTTESVNAESPQNSIPQVDARAQKVTIPSPEHNETAMPIPSAPNIQVANQAVGTNDSLPPLVYAREPYMTKKDYPTVAIYSNLLYLATTTPNLGLEFAISKQWSLNVYGGINMWEWTENSSMRHWSASLESRFWFCRAFEGHYLGLHGTYADFNIGHFTAIPFLDHRAYVGKLYGGGITYGYHFPIGKRLGFELGLGVGYAHMEYDKYKCAACREKLATETKSYFGPTKMVVSLIYLLD